MTEREDGKTGSLARVPEGVKVPAIVDLTLADVKKFINPKVTDAEAAVFLNICKAQGLDPFKREVYLIKFGNEDAAIVTAKDTFLKRAERNRSYRGFKAGLILSSFGGTIQYREGTFYLDTDTILGGWCEVLRADRTAPIRNELTIKEYLRKKQSGEPTRPWKEMSGTMIRKAAICASHREAFPDECGHMYGAEELGLSESDLPEIEYGKAPEIKLPVELKDYKPPAEKKPTDPEKDEAFEKEETGAAAEGRQPGEDSNGGEVPLPKDAARTILQSGAKKKQNQELGSISEGQVGMIGAVLSKLGYKDDAARHWALSQLLGVEVKSAKHLSSAEASAAIDVLKKLEGEKNGAAGGC
jgi:phage recombination protein Bet